MPSDPAQVAPNHVSFRVRLPWAPDPDPDQTQTLPLIPTAVCPAEELRVAPRTGTGAGTGRAARPHVPPVVWPGGPGAPVASHHPRTELRSGPADTAATQQLLQAVRSDGTRLLPRVDHGDETLPIPVPRLGGATPPPGADFPGAPYSAAAYDYPDDYRDYYGDELPEYQDEETGRHAEPVRHAWYPGRRMNLGMVLLPLRVFLGSISVYAGMGKLCDPVYFDGGERGSMVHWLSSLHPWAAGAPLRDFALEHPVGAGLTVAFAQIIVGVLTVLGLWQRVAAGIGMALSVALLITVSWRAVPAYDAPDIIYLAAWSPLLIAGAPVYSVDGRLAADAWRRLGPRVSTFDLRRRVLRRGMVFAFVAVGVTLLIGSALGGAVRASKLRTELPDPSDLPTNNLPGSPLPVRSTPGDDRSPSERPREQRESSSPSAVPSSPSAGTSVPAQPTPDRGTGGSGATQGTSHEKTGSTSGREYQTPSSPPRETVEAPPQPAPEPADRGGLGGILGSGSSGLLLGMDRHEPPGSVSA